MSGEARGESIRAEAGAMSDQTRRRTMSRPSCRRRDDPQPPRNNPPAMAALNQLSHGRAKKPLARTASARPAALGHPVPLSR